MALSLALVVLTGLALSCALLGLPEGQAKPLILLVEAALTLSIAGDPAVEGGALSHLNSSRTASRKPLFRLGPAP
jgi:hypothetical protein